MGVQNQSVYGIKNVGRCFDPDQTLSSVPFWADTESFLYKTTPLIYPTSSNSPVASIMTDE